MITGTQAVKASRRVFDEAARLLRADPTSLAVDAVSFAADALARAACLRDDGTTPIVIYEKWAEQYGSARSTILEIKRARSRRG